MRITRLRCGLRFRAGALDFAGRQFDGAVVGIVALVDRDVVHPHRILLRRRRRVRQAHRIAVVFDLAFGSAPSAAAGVAERLVETDIGAGGHGAVVAAVRRLLRRQRIGRLAVRVLIIDRRAACSAAAGVTMAIGARPRCRCAPATNPPPAAAINAAAALAMTARFMAAP